MSKCLQHGDGEGVGEGLVELTDHLNMTKSHMTFKRYTPGCHNYEYVLLGSNLRRSFLLQLNIW